LSKNREKILNRHNRKTSSGAGFHFDSPLILKLFPFPPVPLSILNRINTQTSNFNTDLGASANDIYK